MTPCSIAAGTDSRLSPTPGFLKQEQEAERRVTSTQTLEGPHLLSSLGKGSGSSLVRDPNPTHVHSRAQHGELLDKLRETKRAPSETCATAPTPGGRVPISGLWDLKPLVGFASWQPWVQVGVAPLPVLMSMRGSLPSHPLGALWGDQAACSPLVPELPLAATVIL